MKTVSIINAALLLLLICAPLSRARASLLDGHYQITGMMITTDGGQSRGFNNTGLYIAADSRRVRVVGAWRGMPIKRDAVIEKVIGDTLVLRDAENRASVYKFHIRNNVITGRHAFAYDDGTREIVNSRATVRKMGREEVDRLRYIIDFGI